ncbi:tyrosine-protein phosphatase [Streptacidiphilus cavernicola]|uniref:Tyrosine-protein phosphatase n=1 Tax=Streptacidiphilus cavernicola TaxID=3342716 RepID=A0ABV6VVZ8_9ACTN
MPPETARALGLSAAPNGRDLGGYRTADGRTVRRGLALRADALSRLTDPDVELLGGLGVRTVVDLRGLNEVAQNGDDRLPEGARLVPLPVYSPEHDIYLSLREVLAGQDAVAQQALLGNGGAERIMAGMYRWFVTDPGIRALFAAAVRLAADPDAAPVLFHCTAGKDRTGWTAAVLLTALGVDRDTVYADYLLTNERSAALTERVMEVFRTNAVMEDPGLMMPVIRAEAAYLDAAFDAVAEGWPSFDAFLAEGLGLDAATLAALRKNLLTDADSGSDAG